MQAVGRLGSYISRSVYNVSGTFHPFGGSVDIIVVEQPDGSFKSSPWYVRFGKFQGVLKSKEKVVTISVNSVDTDFHMYLDNRGEAFFLKEVDVEKGESFSSPPTSSGEEMDGQPENEMLLKSKSCNYDSSFYDSVGTEKSVDRNSVTQNQRLGSIFWRKRSLKGERVQGEEKSCEVFRTDSLERAEIAANLLDLKWSTASPLSKKDNASRFSSIEVKCADSTLHLGDKLDSHKPVESESRVFCVSEVLNVTESHFQIQGSDEKLVLSEPCFSTEEGAKEIVQYNDEASDTRLLGLDGVVQQFNNSFRYAEYDELSVNPSGDLLDKGDQISFVCDVKMCCTSKGTVEGASESIVTEGHLQKVSIEQSNDSFKDIASKNSSNCSSFKEETSLSDTFEHASPSVPSSVDSHTSVCELIPQFNQVPGIFEQEQNLSHNSDDFVSTCMKDSYTDDERMESVFSSSCMVAAEVSELSDAAPCSLPNNGPVTDNKATDLGSAIVENNNHLSPGSQTVEIVNEILEPKEDSQNFSIALPGNLNNDASSFRGSPRRKFSFSFKRSRSKNVSQVEGNSCGNNFCLETVDGPGIIGEEVSTKLNMRKRLVRTLIPTSEQLASLNLKQGKNLVSFTFATAMLGKQQVDARIFLWRWDTRIVISDVDGTITRSDLLGQVMPLVGMDWSQSGVAHLFSAIKENGYQLLFLSARSIAQSFLTRQFLCNIKQDGKVLPEGPVVISPDGLFPSLFREVIRRAPHEFKIACLEDIRALFPADRNPFYAGFGNRETDEFSYLKVGIPKGKIFIINPRGEIVVNRRVDTKSYLSLHSLVHGMFPTMSSCEQEDFNSWNYWKLPPPVID